MISGQERPMLRSWEDEKRSCADPFNFGNAMFPSSLCQALPFLANDSSSSSLNLTTTLQILLLGHKVVTTRVSFK